MLSLRLPTLVALLAGASLWPSKLKTKRKQSILSITAQQIPKNGIQFFEFSRINRNSVRYWYEEGEQITTTARYIQHSTTTQLLIVSLLQ